MIGQVGDNLLFNIEHLKKKGIGQC